VARTKAPSIATATLNATTIQANPAMLRGAAAAFCKEIGPHAANRVIAAGLCDLEGNSSTSAGARRDAQAMQRGCSTGAKEAASRVFNVERIAASTASL